MSIRFARFETRCISMMEKASGVDIKWNHVLWRVLVANTHTTIAIEPKGLFKVCSEIKKILIILVCNGNRVWIILALMKNHEELRCLSF